MTTRRRFFMVVLPQFDSNVPSANNHRTNLSEIAEIDFDGIGLGGFPGALVMDRQTTCGIWVFAVEGRRHLAVLEGQQCADEFDQTIRGAERSEVTLQTPHRYVLAKHF